MRDSGVCSCVVFVMHFQLNSQQLLIPPNLYYIKDGVNINTTHLEEIYNVNFGKVVIDLILTHYLESVALIYSSRVDKPTMEVFSDLHGDYQPCFLLEQLVQSIYTCNRLARLITITGEGELEEIGISAHETKIEHYIGCFNSWKMPKESRIKKTLEDCNSRCVGTRFYGMKDKRCYCINSLTEIIPVSINLCSATCPNISQICGSDIHFSVYSKEILQKNRQLVYPDWGCLFESRNCTECPKGRKGFSCEFIDCDVKNGDCEDMECQTGEVWGRVTFGACVCENGFSSENASTCKEVKVEVNYETTTYPIAEKEVKSYFFATIAFNVFFISALGLMFYLLKVKKMSLDVKAAG